MDMELQKYSEVTDWYGVLASFVLIGVGWGTGPTGWVNNALTAANAILVFRGLTSTNYANEIRLEISHRAMTHLNNARVIVWNPGQFDNYKFSIVNGFNGYGY